MPEEIDYPSLQEQGKNLARFTFEVLKEAFKGNNEKLFVNADVQKKRLDICKECPYFDGSQGRCKHCGCFLSHKVKFSLESCPIDKWHVSEEDWMEGKFNEIAEQVLNPDPEVDRPRFPADVVIGDKYSWTMPPPDGRVMHWFWNGATWEFDPDPETPNYSDEEIAAYRAEREAIQLEERKKAFGDNEILNQKYYEEEEWERHLRREAGEDVPDESVFRSEDGSSLEGLLAQYRRKEQMTEERNQQLSQEAAMERINEEEDEEEVDNLIDSIINEVMSDTDLVESLITEEESVEENVDDNGEENVPIDPMINSMIKDFREELVDKVDETPVKKKRTYKKKTTTESATPKKRGRPKKIKDTEN